MTDTVALARQAECALLGLALFHPRAYAATVERYHLGLEHFADFTHRRIFSEIQSLREAHADPDAGTVAHRIADMDGDQILTVLGQLSSSACVPGNAAWWAEQLRTARARRAVVTAAERIAENARLGDVDGAVEAASTAAATVAEQCQSPAPVTARGILGEWMSRLSDARARHAAPYPRLIGWPMLEGFVGGLLPGEMLVIGGPTSAGKSSLVRCIATDVAGAGQPVGIVSAEDTADTWSARLVADAAGLPVARLRDATFPDDRWPDVMRAAAALSRLPLRIAALRSGVPVADVLASIRQVATDEGGLLIVDYLQAIRDRDPRGRHAELSDTLAQIKNEAGKLGQRLIVTSQLNREGVREGRTNAPRLTALKETGDAEVMAEGVALLWCRLQHEDRQEHATDCMELHVVKAKNGRRGSVSLRWYGDRTRYEEAP